MNGKLLLRRIAQREFDEAADWYEEQRAGLGSQFISEVSRVLANISLNPEMYPIVHQDLREGLVHAYPFAIYYRVEDQQVVVVSVFHTSRNPAIWQKR